MSQFLTWVCCCQVCDRSSSAQVCCAKNTRKCMKVSRFGHWYGDKVNDSGLFLGTLYSSSPIRDDQHCADSPTSQSQQLSRQQPASSVALNPSNAHSPAVAFNRAIHSPSSSNQPMKYRIGPKVENGVPYSAIGFREPCDIAPDINTPWPQELGKVPKAVRNICQWCYRSSEYANKFRLTFRPILLPLTLPNGVCLGVSHLVLDGCSS